MRMSRRQGCAAQGRKNMHFLFAIDHPFHLIQDLLHHINFGDLQTGRWLMEDMVRIKGCSTIRQPVLNRQLFDE